MIYNPYFEKHGIDAVVVPMGCKARDYPAFLKLLFRLSNIHGALVTMPHKITTIALLDEVLTTAKIAGSCNAIRLGPSGALVGDMFDGDMFDGEGFVRGAVRKGRWRIPLIKSSLPRVRSSDSVVFGQRAAR